MKKLIKRAKNQTGTVSAYKKCDRYCPCFNCLGMKSVETAQSSISASNIEADRKSRN